MAYPTHTARGVQKRYSDMAEILKRRRARLL